MPTCLAFPEELPSSQRSMAALCYPSCLHSSLFCPVPGPPRKGLRLPGAALTNPAEGRKSLHQVSPLVPSPERATRQPRSQEECWSAAAPPRLSRWSTCTLCLCCHSLETAEWVPGLWFMLKGKQRAGFLQPSDKEQSTGFRDFRARVCAFLYTKSLAEVSKTGSSGSQIFHRSLKVFHIHVRCLG